MKDCKSHGWFTPPDDSSAGQRGAILLPEGAPLRCTMLCYWNLAGGHCTGVHHRLAACQKMFAQLMAATSSAIPYT